jgi:uncharacterized repeat protein (TIGR01451 family)
VTLVSVGTCTIQATQSGNANWAAAPAVNQSFAVTQVLGTNALLVGSAAGTSSVVLSYTGTWTATANDPFLHISSGSASGTNSGLAVFTYDAFTGTGTRTGTLTVAGLTVTVTQAGTDYLVPGPVITLVSSGLTAPQGLAVDGSGNVLIADGVSGAVRESNSSTQQVTTLLGTGLSDPNDVAVDGSGNVYTADSNNNAIIEWIASTQQAITLVSTGLSGPTGLAVDGAGNVYIADTGNNAIKQWNAITQQVTTLVSTGLAGPTGLAVDASGNVYIADTGNNEIKQWSASTQQVSTLVSAGLSGPTGLAVDGSGNVYIADAGNRAIKQWSASTQQVTTLASTGPDYPGGVTVDGSGDVYFSDSVAGSVAEIPFAFVGPANLIEPPSAGSDALLPMLPSTTALAGIFAPTSDQTWLTVGPIANGFVNFFFSANPSASARTAHLMVLGQQITVTQSTSAVLLNISKTHAGNFVQGQNGATYAVTVSNAAGASPTSGTVTVSDALPAGLTATAIGGTGWVCTLATVTCTRGDSLNAGEEYQPLTVSVNVASDAPANVTNTATVSGGGAATVSANDPTTIVQLPILTISETADSATVAAGASIGYTVTVSNSGGAQTGTATAVTLSDSLPAGTGIAWSIAPTYSGPGTCGITGAAGSQSLSCTFGDMAAGATASVHVTSLTSAVSCATYTNPLTAAAGNSGSLRASASAAVQCPTLVVSGPQTLPAGTVAVPYAATTMAATGGTGIYTWSAVGLPAGLAIGAGSGAITGTPSTSNGSPFNVQVTVTDSSSATALGTFPLAIAPLNPCDINKDGMVNIADVQLVIDAALGLGVAPDVDGDGVVTIVDVQMEINAALGLGCQASGGGTVAAQARVNR